MDLFRVQGRWGPSVRLAWVRCVLMNSTDVCGGAQLSKTAPNTFPTPEFFDIWAKFLDNVFQQHVNNIVKPVKAGRSYNSYDRNDSYNSSSTSNNSHGKNLYQYRIDHAGEQQFLRALMMEIGFETHKTADFSSVFGEGANRFQQNSIFGLNFSSHSRLSLNFSNHSLNRSQHKSPVPADVRHKLRERLQISDWNDTLLLSVLHTALRGFFKADLYTTMTEFLSRADGSFGLQVVISIKSNCVPLHLSPFILSNIILPTCVF